MKEHRAERADAPGALELLEEATFLLRRAPLEVMALYYLGTLPFALGALYFWADMRCNADADLRLAGGSLGLALLFVWMKYWQARFCGGLSGLVVHAPAPAHIAGTALAQTILQPWSFVVLPLALLATLPFGWCFAFFQNVTVMGGGPQPSELYRRARQQAALWQMQNHLLMLILSLLGLIVFANLSSGAFLVPRVLKSLLGIESIFTRSNLFLLNSTFWASMAVLTHLCIDPLVKASYLLRCHYGESLTSGADLLADLKELKGRGGHAIATLLLAGALLLAVGDPASAADAMTFLANSPPRVGAGDLDRAIKQVIAGPEFAWRLPRAKERHEELPGFLRSALDLVKKWGTDAGHWIRRALQWLADRLPEFKPQKEDPLPVSGFSNYLIPILYLLLAVCLAVGALFCRRQFRPGGAEKPPVASGRPVPAPDLSDERVTAEDLSDEGWSALAKELLAGGELRLGMRALYLACLAFLARERLIALARCKSNRDYERELARYSHALPEVTASFSRNVALFERAWYGMHGLRQETVETFIANNQRIVSGVQQR